MTFSLEMQDVFVQGSIIKKSRLQMIGYRLTGFKTSKANQWDYFSDYDLTLALSETLWC